MSQKKIRKFFRYIFFREIVVSTVKTVLNCKTSNLPRNLNIEGNSFLYKKLAFIGLAISVVLLNKFYLSKIKSIMYVSWRSVSAYTFIF